MIDPTIEEIVPNCELAGGEGLGVMVQTPNQFFTTKIVGQPMIHPGNPRYNKIDINQSTKSTHDDRLLEMVPLWDSLGTKYL